MADNEDNKTTEGLADSIFFAVFATPLVAIATMVVVSTVVPYHKEGDRDVVGISWAAYMFLCFIPPIPVLHLLSCLMFRAARQRIALTVTAFVVFLVMLPIIGGFAYRQFIGKL